MMIVFIIMREYSIFIVHYSLGKYKLKPYTHKKIITQIPRWQISQLLNFPRVGEDVAQKECSYMANDICNGTITSEKVIDSYIKS